MIIDTEPECTNEDGHQWKHDPDREDSRQYWHETGEECKHCGVVRIRTTTYGYDGLVESDEYTYETDCWEIVHEPDPEFIGYFWHDPSSDPMQYHIQLKHPNLPNMAILLPSGEVWAEIFGEDEYEYDCVMVGHVDEKYQPRAGADLYLTPEQIDIINDIVKDGQAEWKKLDMPEDGTMRPPIEY